MDTSVENSLLLSVVLKFCKFLPGSSSRHLQEKNVCNAELNFIVVFVINLCVDYSCAVLNRPNKLLNTPTKVRGRPPGSKCPYDLGRIDVEWLTSLNKSQHNKGLMELEESVLEKALAYIENKVSSN